MKYIKIEVHNFTKTKETVAEYLMRNNISNRYITNLRKVFGYIKLNGNPVNSNNLISKGDIIEIYDNPNQRSSVQICIIPLDVVYEDEYLLIINKPSGIATMPTKSHYDYNLTGAIANYMNEKDSNFVVRIINRLDKDVAGLIIVSKNSFSSSYFSRHANEIQKTYHAVVCGHIDKDLIIDKKIITVKNSSGINERKRICDENGLIAKTYIHPLKTIGQNTFVKINITGGRTHQIRLHLSSIGHPIVNDYVYGNTGIDNSNFIALVCNEISFIHPMSKEKINLSVGFEQQFSLLIGNQV